VVGGERLTGELLATALRRYGLFEAAWHADDDLDALLDDSMVAVVLDPAAPALRSAAEQGARVVAVVMEPPVSAEDEIALLLGGADAVVSSETATAEVVARVSLVGDGGASVPPVRLRELLERARQRGSRVTSGEDLTPREHQILHSIDRGESVKQTARALGISPKTVENLQSRLFTKLDVRNRAQAVSHAHGLGLIDADDTLRRAADAPHGSRCS
jgi:DNA-binding NarL/FixJ family response regulator